MRARARPKGLRSIRLAELMLLPLLVACEVPVAPVLVDGAQRFEPPPVYHLWWDMVTACSGSRASLSGVQWYVVPGASTVEVRGDRFAGYWSSAGNAIVLAEAAMFDGSLVRHEMLHSITSDAAHPRGAFLGRCGGVVVCDHRCVSEAGALPPLDATMPRLGADVLEVDVVVTPASPSLASYGGWFTMTITARNPWNNPIAVRLTPSGDGGPAMSFRYQFTRGGGVGVFADRVLDEGVTRFAPGETKRRVYDFRIVGDGTAALGGGLASGTYAFLGAFGDNWATAPATVTLSAVP
jgi:hypothetical protein